MRKVQSARAWPVSIRPMRVRGESRARWALVVLVGCVALLASAPTALAASGTGKISGTVTSACACEDFNPLKNIEVTVYEAGENGLPEGFATTNEHGEYTVERLTAGSYKVRFSTVPESTLNFAAQYYKEKSSFTTAEAVPVLEGKTTEKIDAELQVGGKIEGTVTEAASPGNGLGDVGVTVYEANGSKFPVGFATTVAGGKYTVAGLATGTYKVAFSPEFESGLNFIGQFYEGKTSFATAESVAVTQESTTSAINAKLLVGGEISGTVTDGATHKPVANIVVLAYEAAGGEEAFEGFAETNGNGEYAIAGLRNGVYKIQFETEGGGTQYISQFYDDEPSFATANPVTANQGSITPGVNASLVRKAPVNTVAPVASGTPVVGQALSCSKGSWTGSPTLTYAYTWLRNGIAIASGSAYVVQAADQGSGLSCRVTASNKSGRAAAVSNTLVVPPAPPPPPPKPVITLLSTKTLVAGGSARVPIACANATCAGKIELTEQTVVRHRRGRRTIVVRKTLILARGSYALAAGHSATITVRMTAAGKRALSRAGHRRLSAKLVASVSGGLTLRGAVLLSEPKPAKRRSTLSA
jgi:hypothetical protein